MVLSGKAGKRAVGKPAKTQQAVSEASDVQLAEWAQQDAAAMTALVALIPAVHLKPQDGGREIAKKYMKKVSTTVSDKVARAAEGKRAKKRAKFDGSELADAKGDSDSEEDDGEDAGDSSNDEDMSEDEIEEAPEPAKRKPAPAAPQGNATHRAKSREELQELLAKKMQEFASKRPKEDQEIGEKASEKRKRKREEKKEKKKKLNAKKKQQQSSVPIPSPMPKAGGGEPGGGKGKASEASSDADFSFGRIKMAGEDIVGGGRDKGKKYREQPEKLLKKIEDKKTKLEELGGAESEAGKKFLERQKWGSSIDRAQGVKVKDDEQLLKKTINKKLKEKAKRTEKWTKRAQDIEDSRGKRIAERNENIKKRIADRRDKKMGIKKKKGAADKGKGKPKPKMK